MDGLKSFGLHLGFGVLGAVSCAATSVLGGIAIGFLHSTITKKRRSPGPDGGAAGVFLFLITCLAGGTAALGGLVVGVSESPTALLICNGISLVAGGAMFIMV